MGVMPFLAACHACVLMLYCIVTIVCYVCSFEWQIKLPLSLLLTMFIGEIGISNGTIDLMAVSYGNCFLMYETIRQDFITPTF